MNSLKPVGIIAVIALLLYFGGCSYRNVDGIKSVAVQTWGASGYDVIGYEGYQLGHPFGAPGGKVWYIVQRKGRPEVTYSGFLAKWGQEIHIYNLEAIDAISPK